MKDNKKSITSEALLEMASIKDAFAAESKNEIKSLMAEAVKDALRDSICDETCNEEDDNHIQEEGKKASKSNSKKKNIKEDDEQMADDEQQPEQQDAEQQQQNANSQEAGANEEVPNYDVAGEDNQNAQPQEQQPSKEDSDEFAQYQVDGNPGTYDLTGVKDQDELVKVYRRLSDNDNVVVKKEGNIINLTDNQTGAEYVINTEGEDNSQPVEGEQQPVDDSETETDEEPKEQMNEEFDDELNFDDTDKDGDDVIDIDFSDEDGNDNLSKFDDDEEFEFDSNDMGDSMDGEEDEEIAGFKNDVLENKGKNMKSNKEQVFEVDFGYSDDYQDFDDVQNDAPQNDEFEFIDDEEETTPDLGTDEEEPVEEAATSKSKRDRRHMTKTRSTGEYEVNPQVTKVHSSNGEVNESLKKLKDENKVLKNAIVDLKKELKEAYMTNVNLGKITKLFLENTTTQKEKIDIINRFTNEAKTVKQSTELFESINRQLKAERRANPVLEQKSTTPVAKQTINETKIYESDDLKATKDFMKRMLEC